jgi:outer membrane protein TolC
MEIANNPLGCWASILLGAAFVAVPTLLPAQVSLVTVVDLAQRNSSAVRLASTEVQKAQAALSETKDAYVPSLVFGSGLPALPSVGFQGDPPSIANATIHSLVFSPPQREYIKAARASLDAATLNLRSAREQVVLYASTAYIELDTVDQELDAAQQQESFSDRLVKIEQERTEAGVDSMDDLLQANLTAAELELKCLHLETRANTLAKELAAITGLPVDSIAPDHASIPEIPEVRAGESKRLSVGIESVQLLALSKQRMAQGDKFYTLRPQISFSTQYNRDTTLLNNADSYFARPLKSDNISSGFSIQIPLFDLAQRARAKQSAADALRARVEAEQAQEQFDLQIAQLTSNLRELNAMAKIANLKREIADEQLEAVLVQLELGNGTGSGPGAQPQLTPKAEQLARINERQKFQDSLEAGLDLSKARLALLSALGHMEDWLHGLHIK